MALIDVHSLSHGRSRALRVKVTLAFLARFVLPMFDPYPYILVNPAEPFLIANLEQSASLFVFLLYLFRL
ncbi:hypothetical protein BDY19DRAFT_990248 [Irpex rosettiformis]|uniref:Uncharacterized protein n=1 Tax=Irpex rosettiformis TaxID=378272 RepID=A0ACB8UDY6_9APHY|nr:hypothetical protein BDY19DRAFT_990248 [Irpex rosettiformis]